MKVKFAIAAIVAFAAVSASAVTAAPPSDACTLLTKEQVGEALGVAIQPGEHIVPNVATACGWAPPGGPSMAGRKLVVSIKPVKYFDTGKTPMEGITKAPAAGIGDDAYYTTAGGFGTNLSVKKGDFAFTVALHGDFPADQIKAKEKALAQLILAKL